MMMYQDFTSNPELISAASAYTAKYGGHFGGGEPGGELMYETDDGEMAYVPPEGATAAQVLQDLQSGKALSELWPELVYDPDLIY